MLDAFYHFRRFPGQRWGGNDDGDDRIAAAGTVHSAKVSGRGRPRRRTHQTLGVSEEHRRCGRQQYRRPERDTVAQDQVRIIRGRATPTAAPATAAGRHQHTRPAQRTVEENAGHRQDHERSAQQRRQTIR